MTNLRMFSVVFLCLVGVCQTLRADTATEMAIITANQGTTPAAGGNAQASNFNLVPKIETGSGSVSTNGVRIPADGELSATGHWRWSTARWRYELTGHYELRGCAQGNCHNEWIYDSPASLPTTVGPVQRRGVFGWRK